MDGWNPWNPHKLFLVFDNMILSTGLSVHLQIKYGAKKKRQSIVRPLAMAYISGLYGADDMFIP